MRVKELIEILKDFKQTDPVMFCYSRGLVCYTDNPISVCQNGGYVQINGDSMDEIERRVLCGDCGINVDLYQINPDLFRCGECMEKLNEESEDDE